MDIIGKLTALLGPGAVAILGWWLSGQFRTIEKAYTASLAAHEEKDQERHEQNLDRFGSINMKLARLGSNGHDDSGDWRDSA